MFCFNFSCKYTFWNVVAVFQIQVDLLTRLTSALDGFLGFIFVFNTCCCLGSLHDIQPLLPTSFFKLLNSSRINPFL